MVYTITNPYSPAAQRILSCGAPGSRLGGQMKKKPSRQRVQLILVRVLPSEKEEIKTRAKACGMSVACYLRTLGLNHRPKAVLDAKAVMELARVNGDLGRLGGLLKMLLTNNERLKGQDRAAHTIEALLADIQTTQATLFEAARRV